MSPMLQMQPRTQQEQRLQQVQREQFQQIFGRMRSMQEPAERQQARYVSFWFPWTVKLRYTIIYPDSNASKSKAEMHP